jgi:serine/threonine protein kinase
LFAPPEQVRGGELTPSADSWGLGVVLYRASTGQLPFNGDGSPQLTQRARPVAELLPNLPAWAPALIDSMLHPMPAERPTMADVLTAAR